MTRRRAPQTRPQGRATQSRTPQDRAVDETRTHDVGAEPETVTVQRHEERLVPHVRSAEAGRVRLQKRVVEEPAAIDVRLQHDELDLDRRRADRPLAAGEEPVTVRGEETVVLVIEERLQARKIPWVVEEIHLRRRLTSETRRIEDTVRKERFEIRTEGDVDLDQQ